MPKLNQGAKANITLEKKLDFTKVSKYLPGPTDYSTEKTNLFFDKKKYGHSFRKQKRVNNKKNLF